MPCLKVCIYKGKKASGMRNVLMASLLERCAHRGEKKQSNVSGRSCVLEGEDCRRRRRRQHATLQRRTMRGGDRNEISLPVESPGLSAQPIPPNSATLYIHATAAVWKSTPQQLVRPNELTPSEILGVRIFHRNPGCFTCHE